MPATTAVTPRARIGSLVRRDLRIAFGRGGAMLPILFYLLVAILLPFAIGSDRVLLARIGGGGLWIAALLAALLPIDRLVAADIADGTIDQLVLREVSEETIIVARLTAHWLSFGPPLMLATLPAAALLGLPLATVGALELGLLLGTPGLAALGLATAAITAGLGASGNGGPGSSALAGLVMLPLAVPLLIFGGGLLADGGVGAAKLLGATSLLLAGGTPFLAGAALRAARD